MVAPDDATQEVPTQPATDTGSGADNDETRLIPKVPDPGNGDGPGSGSSSASGAANRAADETAVLPPVRDVPDVPVARPADETAKLPPVRDADPADRVPPGYFRDGEQGSTAGAAHLAG